MDNKVVVGNRFSGMDIYGKRAENKVIRLKDLPANILDSKGGLPVIEITGGRRNTVHISIKNGAEGEYRVRTSDPERVKVLPDDAGRGHITDVYRSHRTNYVPAPGQRLVLAG